MSFGGSFGNNIYFFFIELVVHLAFGSSYTDVSVRNVNTCKLYSYCAKDVEEGKQVARDF